MSDAIFPLWRTKLHRPPVTSTLVQRPQLFDRLNRGLNRRLTLVCAPAGFGKTTLITSWVESFGESDQRAPQNLRAAWLSLEETDSDLLIFLNYLVSAVRTIFDDACPQTFDLLQARHMPPLKAIANLLSNEIDLISTDFILVLDDFHNIRGEAVPNLISELLFHWPRPLRLILTSRTNPSLPLTRLRMDDQLTEIRTHDLRFNTEESRQFLNLVLQIPASERVVNSLQDRAEGWIGAMRLIAVSLRDQNDMDSRLALADRPPAALVDYLVEEILEKQTPSIRNFLMKTSFLDRFCVPLCEAVIGESNTAWDTRDYVNWLVREEFFVIPLDDDGIWYRFHSILKKVLQRRLNRSTDPTMLNDLHERASIWFEQEGLIDEAIRHALFAENNELVVSQVERGLRDALNRTDWHILERWSQLLPENLVQNSPVMLVTRAESMHSKWQLNEVLKDINRAEYLLENDKDGGLSDKERQILLGQIATFKAQNSFFHNQHKDVDRLCKDALALLPESWRFLRGGATFYLGLSLQAAGQGEAAERMLLELYEPLKNKSDAFALRLLFGLCFVYQGQGLLERTRETAFVLYEQASRSLDTNMQSWANYFLGCVHYQWNELEDAERYFAAIARNPYVSHQLALENGEYGLVLVHQARGELPEAMHIVELLGRSDIERIGYEAAATRSLRAWLMFLQGDLESTFRWADDFKDAVPDQPLLWLEIPHLTKARILLARKSPKKANAALLLLDELLELAERTFNKNRLIEIYALRAMVLDLLGRKDESLAELAEAVRISEIGYYRRVFIDLGSHMQELLGKLALTGRSRVSVERIVDTFPTTESQKGTADGQFANKYPSLIEPLTPREKQILVILQEPVSMKEISLDLGLQYATVKRHTVNIYSKLGVNSRWDAVAKAKNLGILSN